jgi:hypothetical protein
MLYYRTYPSIMLFHSGTMKQHDILKAKVAFMLMTAE